jgi:YD repeat-containing protein
LALAGSATSAMAWMNSGSGNELLPYLLAWNHSYSLPYQSSYSLTDLTGFNRNYSSLQLPAGERVESGAGFDFYMVPTPQAGSTTRIVFASNRDGNAQLYSMDASGGSLIRLTNNGANDDHPRWSPNGSKILLQSDRDNPATGASDIYVMNANGTGQTRLTVDAADDCNAVWSPDGSKIVFQSLRNGSYYQIYSMNANGTNQVNITNGSSADSQPSWSPDGLKIAFASERDHAGMPSVYVMNANGSNQTRLTSSSEPFRDEQPIWSPDSSRIAFVSTRDSVIDTWQETDDNGLILTRTAVRTNKEVYLMNANGTGQARLTNTLENDDAPGWSPEGTKIIFRSDRERDSFDPTQQLWVMNSDGANQAPINSNVFGDYSASWNVTINQAPVAQHGGPYSGLSVTAIQFNGSNSVDIDGAITSYQWNFGDGTTGVGATVSHSYATPGTRTVTLTVTDNNGAQANASTTATIANRPPVANAGGPYSGVVAQNIPFSAGGSYDPDGSITSYAWNFGDGGTGSGFSLTHAYSSPGNYSTTLTVTDNLGAQTTATTTASITAAASEQYLVNFNQSALARPPSANESTYWNDILRSAYPNGQSSMLLAVRELGKTLFESADYASRNRDNHWYVYDLYKTYLMRDPDAPGWTFWENELSKPNPLNREQLRRAFDECSEFAGIVATLTPSGSPSSSVSSLASARVDPFNQPGNGLTSRAAEWSVPLLSLPGRAGLDLGLSLSYSSMVWTRSGPYIYFDEDNGWPGPGFRLGFPTIQEKVFDAQAGRDVSGVSVPGRNVYLLIAGGSRVSLRQMGTSNVYEAADSSYLQLTDYGSSLLLRTTDGTQLSYQPFNSEWRCTQIKDRNGNYLTVNYDWLGHIANVIDTLNRTINFNYDPNANLLSITQNWTVNGSAQTHTWASFGWTTKTLQPSFSGVMVVGARNGLTIPVLSQVGLDDGTRYTFEYNAAGQVSPIRSYRSDNVERSYTAYDYDSPADDCPRLIDTHTWALNWTGINGMPQEVAILYGAPGDGSHTMTTPDGTLYKEFYGTGYKRGLTTQTEVWSGGVRQKLTSNNWTQDNTGVSYQTNPRVTETNVFDAGGNRRRTTVNYTPSFTLPSGASCSLPRDTREYAGDGTSVLRRTHVDYRMDPDADATYLARHIIGLIKEQTLYEVSGGTETLMSRVGFSYDEAGSVQGSDTPVSHDNSYDGNFVAGRANLSSVKRYDTINSGQWTVSSMQYNTAGAVVYTTDPLSRHTTISYADSFSDGNNARNTLAYPKTMTDADGYSSTLIYNFDLGAITSKQTPQPNTTQNLPGPVQTFGYDSAGRLERTTATTNGAYTRYAYGPDYVQVFSTVNTLADEAYSVRHFDGAGRVMLASGNHPGSSGSYSAQHMVYDAMGRVIKQSNPTEMTGGWLATGDDSAGWRYTQQTYDWKGRPLVTTHPDGTTKEASYEGCGCAGGEVMTLTDEGTIDQGMAKRRQSRVYSDVLGRTVKTELLNWQGGSPYSTTVNSYNARDQITSVRQFDTAQGTLPSNLNDLSCPTGSCQQTTMTYDGYGRLQSRHLPKQAAGAQTFFAYNLDDTIQKITDARGSLANYSYNARRLVTGITYDPAAGIPDTPDVSFGYDAVGNRKSVTDGFGSKNYNYSQLSQLQSETRTFNGVGAFTLSYDYNLAGELKKITDATGMTINYGYDSAGRPSSVTGSDSLYAGVSNYASNFQYRAWGGVKAFTDGKGHVTSMTYNSRLQATRFNFATVQQNYAYYNDGRVSIVNDTVDQNFDRSYSYDHAGRIVEARSGADVNGSQFSSIPYRETFGYDAFSNLTARQSDLWNGVFSDTDSASYADFRREGWGYDADGRNTTIDTRTSTFDAVGRQTSMLANEVLPNGTLHLVTQTKGYDAEGAMVHEAVSGVSRYYLRSSVIGGAIIEELGSDGQKNVGYVYTALGTQLARQYAGSVTWKHNTPAQASQYTSNSASSAIGRTEFDPLGADVPLTEPITAPPNEGEGDLNFGRFAALMDARWSDFRNLAAGCGVAAAGCTGHVNGRTLEGAMLAAFGARRYDLPGQGNESARGEERYERQLSDGFDNEFQRFEGATITYNNGVVANNATLTLDEYHKWETGYLPDSGTVDLETNTVTVYGGAQYLISQQTERSKSYTGPCPPTKQQLAANPIVIKKLDEAFKRSLDRGVEHGGWIYWNKNSGKIVPYIKEPTIARLNPDITDKYDAVFLNSPGTPPKGWFIVATFHTHPEEVNEDPQDIAVDNSRKIPGMVRMPSGRISTYGAYDRGIWDQDLPRECQ